MKNNLKEEILNTLEIYDEVLEFFSGTFSDDFYFQNITDFLKENNLKRKEFLRNFKPSDNILKDELFTVENTAEKFKFFLEKIKESEVSIEGAYSLLFGLESSILEKLLPVKKYLKSGDPLLNFIEITNSSIKFLRENSKHFNLTFL